MVRGNCFESVLREGCWHWSSTSCASCNVCIVFNKESCEKDCFYFVWSGSKKNEGLVGLKGDIWLRVRERVLDSKFNCEMSPLSIVKKPLAEEVVDWSSSGLLAISWVKRDVNSISRVGMVS